MKDVTARVIDGGRLITKGSAQEAGFHNWTVKRDWRREYDQEVTREGLEYFRPNLEVPVGNQPHPQNQPTPPSTVEPITLQCQVRALNGRTAFIAGTPTTLFRYYALEESGYFEDETDQAYWPAAELGQNLVTATTGNYTITTLVVGRKYRWRPGAGETQLVVSGGSTYESYGTPGIKGLWWHQDVGLDFVATNASVTVSGSSGPAAGTLQEVLEEAYVEELGNANTVVVATEDIFIDWSVRDYQQVFVEGVLFRSRLPGRRSGLAGQVLFDDDGSVTGNNATATWDGLILHVKIDSGVTTRAKIEEVIRAQEPEAGLDEFMAEYDVYGGDYVSPGGGPYFERSGVNAPYFLEDNGTWRVIGEGFSKLGHRWECAQVGDYTVFNNGKDLPVTYQIDDDEVTPIYELREQGVASVGTIGVVNDVLLCGDVSAILDAELPSICGHTDSGLVTANQTGSLFSGSITATAVGLLDVQSSAAFFQAGWVGRTIQFANGFTTTITAFVSTTRVTLADSPTSIGLEPHVFWVIHLTNDYLLNCSAGFFTAAMVGQSLYFDNTGVSRKIMAFNSTTQVKVDTHLPVTSGLFQLENITAYGRYEESANIVRNQLKYIWSIPGNPRRWAAVFPGSMTTGSARLELKYPVRSLEIGMEVTVTGAGINGGLHTSEILFIGANLTTITLADPASSSVTDGDTQATDTVGSIVGEDELATDSSGILRIMELGGAAAFYKGESIIFGRYTGDPDAPWLVGGPGGVVRTTLTPFYRWTLVNVTVNGQDMHVYAGRNGFYSVTLATRKPQEIQVLQACKDIFFKEAKLSNTELIFGAECVLTKEVMFWWAGTGEDKGLCWDYEYGTASTTSISARSACSIKRPMQGATQGVAEDWFVIGDSLGRVLRYGKADVPQEGWGGATAIYNRLGSRYAAVLKSGLWGKRFGEFQLSGYQLELASQNPGAVALWVGFYGYDSVAGPSRLMGARDLLLAHIQSMIPTAFLAQWMQDEIDVTVLNTPCALSSRTIYGQGIESVGASRAS